MKAEALKTSSVATRLSPRVPCHLGNPLSSQSCLTPSSGLTGSATQSHSGGLFPAAGRRSFILEQNWNSPQHALSDSSVNEGVGGRASTHLGLTCAPKLVFAVPLSVCTQGLGAGQALASVWPEIQWDPQGQLCISYTL